MKKLICVFFAILTLVFLIVPASADSIVTDGSQAYYLQQVSENIPGLFYLQTTYGEGYIDYVISDEFESFIEDKYGDYKYDYTLHSSVRFYEYIESFLPEGISLIDVRIAYDYVQGYFAHKVQDDLYYEFNCYKFEAHHVGEDISKEGFSKYLESHLSMHDFYMYGIESIFNELFEASSSSSGGSSGDSTPGENQGEHYGASHNNSNHNITDSDCCYDPGYNDGLLDGADEYKESNEYQETINNSKTEAVEQYKQSNEYKETLESVYNEANEYAVDNYLKSEEYELTKDSCFIAGSEAGYTNAYSDLCSDVYYRGVTDGHASFRGSNEHIADMDSSYRMGFDDGVEKERKNAVNPGTVIALMIILFVLLAVLISLFQIKKKKRK